MAENNSSEYWEKRIAASTWKTYNSLEEKNRELLEFYTEASRAVKDEIYVLAEKYSKEGVLTLSEIHKQNRLTQLNQKYEKIAFELGSKSEKFSEENMKAGFTEVYRSTAVGMGDTDFALPDKRLMDKLLNEPWHGDSFSGRLWKNQKRLAVGLNDILLTGLQQGKTVTEIAVQLHNFMGQAFNNCHRLVRTETMHYLNSAAIQRYKDAGSEFVQIWAAQDERTCETCGQYHGEVYPIDECPVLPFHANCRCTILPVTDEKVIAEQVGNSMKLMDSTDKWARAARKELLESERSLIHRSTETMEIYGPDGKFIMAKRGGADSVKLSVLDYSKLKKAVVTHNHPSNGCFSFKDIRFLKNMPISELRVSTEECVYYMRKPEQWPKEIKSSESLEKAIKEIRKELRPKYQKLYNSGKITKVQRHKMFSEEVSRTFAERYGFDYGKETYE